MAIILDEYGGTAGMVTLEDLLEVVFGDLQDEFDREIPQFSIQENRIFIRGDVQLDQINELLGLNLPEDKVRTIGGLFLAESGHIPNETAKKEISGIEFQVELLEDRGIQQLSFAGSEKQLSAVEDFNNA